MSIGYLAVGVLTYLGFCMQALSLFLPHPTLDPMKLDLRKEQVANPYL